MKRILGVMTYKGHVQEAIDRGNKAEMLCLIRQKVQATRDALEKSSRINSGTKPNDREDEYKQNLHETDAHV